MSSALAVPADAIRIPNSRTLRFEGEGYGATVSFFLVTNDPGQGPSCTGTPTTRPSPSSRAR